jgi:uncharacterized protein YecE (DUF72 family)
VQLEVENVSSIEEFFAIFDNISEYLEARFGSFELHNYSSRLRKQQIKSQVKDRVVDGDRVVEGVVDGEWRPEIFTEV